MYVHILRPQLVTDKVTFLTLQARNSYTTNHLLRHTKETDSYTKTLFLRHTYSEHLMFMITLNKY